MMRLLVTGASGFVGRSVCLRLQQAGHAVRAAVRQSSRCGIRHSGIEVAEVGDIESFPDWSVALAGVDAVVHLVARTHQMHESGTSAEVLERYRAINVTGTRHLLAACERSAVRRFVFMSSIKAVGEGQEGHDYHEEDPCRPEDAYGISKREAEELVLASTKVAPIVLRPPLVYGPGVKGNLARMIKAVQRGVPLPLGGIRNRRSLVHVENLADAIAVCLEHPQATGEIFHVADEQPISTPELIGYLSAGLSRPPRLVHVPEWLLRGAGTVLGLGSEFRRLLGSLTISTTKIRDCLDWHPPMTTEEGLRMTATGEPCEVRCQHGPSLQRDAA